MTAAGTIVSVLDGQCLSVYPRTMRNPSLRGWDVVTLPCESGAAYQQWKMESDGTVSNAGAGAGARHTGLACHSPRPLTWYVDDGALATACGAQIVSGANSECLTVFQDLPVGTTEVWAGPLADGSVAAILLNQGTTSASITAQWSDVMVPPGSATVRDLWQHKDLGTCRMCWSRCAGAASARCAVGCWWARTCVSTSVVE